MLDPKHFVKFVLTYIIKHGDTFENEEAERMLSRIREEDLKSAPAPLQVSPISATVELTSDTGPSAVGGVAGVVMPPTEPSGIQGKLDFKESKK